MQTLIHPLLEWIQNLWFATAIREGEWQFPTIETVHVLALTLVVGSISMLDLRLIGISSRKYGVAQLANEVLPWTWGFFCVAAITGFMMFASNAVKYPTLFPFQAKFVFMALAGLNMAAFHVTIYRTVHQWNHQLPPPRGARIAGVLSLSFWIAVVVCGRWIGFV